ncbi:sensor histidine kinase [Hyalangium rubrum]|uniref:histidine kinase n=1 Tax=Hyalangium rubrum TaxID=3103134 RepID=A0ABU5GZE5_9BACT|nr:response regulator [Hyalangium sp. s54d21]MDY7226549.1 response regulator [Hyalangium sp. s54d21]
MPEPAPPFTASLADGAASPPRVLIADDDMLSRTTVAALLSPAGYRLRFATNGEEALLAVSEEPPDLVLLDVMMPVLDGFEVCRRLRESLRGDYMPIVLVTALDERQDVLRGLEAGADDFLHKPVHGAELRARVSNLLKVRAYHQLLASQRDSAMATADALRQQVLHADRLATLGTFAAGVSHELNNIAQVLHGLLEPPGPSAPQGTVEVMDSGDRDMLAHVASHVTELSRTILNIARPEQSSALDADLGRTLEEVRNMLRLTGRMRHARVSLVLPEQPCRIRANPVHAQQVFLNLLSNAADAIADMPEPSIEAGVRTGKDGRVEAWVRDNGPGIPDAVLGRIFEPFFTTKAPGHGTGLGLPVVKQLVESWGGRIHVHTQPGSGTRMVLDVPAVAPPLP